MDTLTNGNLWISCSIYGWRVIDISMGMAIAAAQQYESNEVVCPLIMRKNLFTTAAVDNIDHNPSWATAHDAVHGRGIYITLLK